MLKMVLKYDRPASPGSDDIATRIFNVPFGKLTAYYHFDALKITGKVRTFLHTRGPSIPVMSDQAMIQELGLEEDPDELQDAAAAEREAFAAKREYGTVPKDNGSEGEVEANPLMDRSVFDLALDGIWNINLGDRLIGVKKIKAGDSNQDVGGDDGGASMDESKTMAEVANDSNLHTADYLGTVLTRCEGCS